MKFGAKVVGLLVLLISLVGCFDVNDLEVYDQIVTIDVNPDMSGDVSVAWTVTSGDMAYFFDGSYNQFGNGIAEILGWNDYTVDGRYDSGLGLEVTEVSTSFNNPDQLSNLLSDVATFDNDDLNGLNRFGTPYGEVYTFNLQLNSTSLNATQNILLLRMPGSLNTSTGSRADDGFYQWSSTTGDQTILATSTTLPTFEAEYDIEVFAGNGGNMDITITSSRMDEAVSYYGSLDNIGERIAEGHGLSNYDVRTFGDETVEISTRFGSYVALSEILVDEAVVFDELRVRENSTFLNTEYTVDGELAADSGIIGYPSSVEVSIEMPGKIQDTSGSETGSNTIEWSSGSSARSVTAVSSSVNVLPIILGVGLCLGLVVVGVVVLGGGVFAVRKVTQNRQQLPQTGESTDSLPAPNARLITDSDIIEGEVEPEPKQLEQPEQPKQEAPPEKAAAPTEKAKSAAPAEKTEKGEEPDEDDEPELEDTLVDAKRSDLGIPEESKPSSTKDE